MAGGRTANLSGFALACGRRDEENKKKEGEKEGKREEEKERGLTAAIMPCTAPQGTALARQIHEIIATCLAPSGKVRIHKQ